MLEVFLRSIDTIALGGGRSLIGPLPQAALPFPKWRIQDVRSVVAADIPQEYRWAKNMYDGDHWQGGWGYAGPMVAYDDPNYTRLWHEIMKQFSSRNVIREVAETHVNGLLARPMRWSLVPIRTTADERDNTGEDLKSLIAEASAIIRVWLDQRQAHEKLRAFATDLLMPPGRSTLSLFLPTGAGESIAEGSRVMRMATGNEFGQTMGQVFLEHVPIERGRVFTDPDTMREIGVKLIKTRNRDGQYRDAANLTFLDANGEKTIVATVYEDGTAAAVPYDLGGRLTMFQAERTPLITAQILQQNRILNYAESTIPRNLTTAGFLDRYLIAASLNGRWVRDETTGVERYLVDEESKPTFGPGEVTAVQPEVYTDEEGRIHVTSPSVERGEPVMPTGSIESSKHIYNNMLREAGQAHLVEGMDSDAAVIRYGLSLMQSAPPVVSAGRWMIESALAWAEALRGEPGRFTSKLRAQVSVYINVGPVTPEQRAALIAAFEKSIISRETAQELMGVEDVDSENDRIAAQPGQGIDLAIRQANAFKMFREAGLPAGIAAKRAGFSEDEAAEMEREFQKQQAADQAAKQTELKLQAANKVQNGQPGSSGLRSARRGRPSGTAERNPGQGQDKGARALQIKKRNRSQP
jgi:hypothetical protein